MTNWVILLLGVIVLCWEGIKLVQSWMQQSSVWAGIRYSRHDTPTTYWILVSLHSILFLLLLAVIGSLAFRS